MSNPIRVSGLVLFIFIVGIISAAYLLFADRILKSTIIEIGTEAVGAKVDLAKGSINLDEFSVSLTDLAVTNPNAPMRNVFEAENIAFNLDSDALLWKKTIIDEILVENLFLDTSRAESGAIDGRRFSLDNVEAFDKFSPMGDLSSIELPDPKTIVAKSNLETLTEIEKFQSEVKQQTTALEADYKNLPTQESLDKHKQQLSQLKKKQKSGNRLLGLLSQGSELKDLQKTIKKDLNAVKAFGKKVKVVQKNLSSRISYIKTLPAKDLNRLTNQYSLSGDGVSNLAATVFGEQLGGWVKEAMVWYKRLAPLLDQFSDVQGNAELAEKNSFRNSGRDIVFKDEQSLPDNLIKLIKISSGEQSEQGVRISGQVKNLTSQPKKWKHPLEFNLKGNAQYFEQMAISGIFDHRHKDTYKDMFELSVNKLSLKKLSDLAKDSTFVATGGLLNIISSGNITEDKLNVDIALLFSKARFQMSSTAQSSPWLNKVVKGLAEIDVFEIKVNITGTLDKPELTISAPGLNNLAAKIAEQAVSGKLKEFKQQLKAEILTKTSGDLQGLSGSLGGISSLQELLSVKQLDFDGLLKNLL
ncbi:MAG: hypothetical protein COA74_10385 [Gammaproteobacteria bacterium]|nr:MAG: hypothetical protein COA74_10385 [Gammaproteobacteria bacterium]